MKVCVVLTMVATAIASLHAIEQDQGEERVLSYKFSEPE